MTRGPSPWSDPVLDARRAAHAPQRPPGQHVRPPVADDGQAGPAATAGTAADDQAEAADVAARPLTRTGRRARAAPPGRLSPTRALSGAAVSVAGVLLGIGTLLWLSDEPARDPGPSAAPPPSTAPDGQASADTLGTQPETEAAPVDPVEPGAGAAGSAAGTAAGSAAGAVAPPAAPVVPRAPVVPVPAPPAPAAAPVAPEEPAVTVLNNSRTSGLADRAAVTFRRGGWPIKQTGNFRGRIRATTVYYPAGQRDAAQAFAERFDGIERVLPRFEGLPGSGLTVVLTRDYA